VTTTSSTSRAVIDLGAYAHNLEVVRQRIPHGCGIMAVVKTNAYGLGSVPIARRAVETGVEMLGVATVAEGIELCEAGIELPIVVLVQPTVDQLPAIIEYGLRMMVSELELADLLCEQARRANRIVPVHCKVDTGMGRAGIPLTSALEALRHITRMSHIDVEGVATHFAVAEQTDDTSTAEQLQAFKKLLKEARKAGVPYELAHAANSAAVVNYPESALDVVRPGLMTYGVWPVNPRGAEVPLRPVLRWESRVALVKELLPGATVGYGRTYTATEGMRAALIPVGYADGYPFALGNKAEVLVRGKRCPVRGRVSMDQIVADVTAHAEVHRGDVVTLIGSDGNEEITPWELAERAGTVPNDILTGLGWRVTRAYIA